MRVAIPVSDQLTIYSGNPCSAPKYLIYSIIIEPCGDLLLTEDELIINQHQKKAISLICNCNSKTENDIEHKIWHYTIVESLLGCDYLLIKECCKNTRRSLDVAGIRMVTTPIIIHKPEQAIKNFIIGEKLANNLRHIHYAS
jgi:predicted Fe-Mo cluster-binding NifX family protein